MNEYSALPADPDSSAALAAHGLELGVIDPTDVEATRRWILADSRGFHDAAPNDAQIAIEADGLTDDRITGVWDRSGADPETPIATVRSWAMGMTAPGGTALQAWAISAVTVSPTHRRRGVARALLTAELRFAAERGLSMAMLTVSEATIYGRYGFGPAALQAPYTIDTRRARWTGPIPSGRVQFVTAESLLADGPPLLERARVRSPGEVDRHGNTWKKILGLAPSDPAAKRDVRAVRYDDASGTGQGFALYRMAAVHGDFPDRIELLDLVAVTDDAYAALWRYLIEIDLVDEISAHLRSVSEPLVWHVADRRAVRKTDERDHLWLRILDVPAALEQRTYSAPGDYVLDVSDDLGFAQGSYLLSVAADGTGTAGPLEGEASAGAARAALSIADLGSLYLGGVSPLDLAQAGRITSLTTDAADRLTSAFRSPHTPRLSVWF